jgi:hypothetical protein
MATEHYRIIYAISLRKYKGQYHAWINRYSENEGVQEFLSLSKTDMTDSILKALEDAAALVKLMETGAGAKKKRVKP